jgi:hypothetical protein
MRCVKRDARCLTFGCDVRRMLSHATCKNLIVVVIQDSALCWRVSSYCVNGRLLKQPKNLLLITHTYSQYSRKLFRGVQKIKRDSETVVV